MTLREFKRRFPTTQRCFGLLRRYHYGGKRPWCPVCGASRPWVYTRPSGCRVYTCRQCRQKWSDLTDTIFEHSRTPLTKWFQAVYLVENTPNITVRELKQRLKVTYKTAWRMRHLIRHRMNPRLKRMILGS